MDIKRIAIIILFILFFIIGGYFVRKNFSGADSELNINLLPSPAPSLLPDDIIFEQNARDERRINDLLLLSGKIDDYIINRGYAFITNEGQKISDEESAIFRELKDTGYLDKAPKDPLSDEYYYSYYADEKMYELIAVLENKNSGKCELAGDLCVYKIRKEIETLLGNDFQGYMHDYENENIEQR